MRFCISVLLACVLLQSCDAQNRPIKIEKMDSGKKTILCIPVWIAIGWY